MKGEQLLVPCNQVVFQLRHLMVVQEPVPEVAPGRAPSVALLQRLSRLVAGQVPALSLLIGVCTSQQLFRAHVGTRSPTLGLGALYTSVCP